MSLQPVASWVSDLQNGSGPPGRRTVNCQSPGTSSAGYLGRTLSMHIPTLPMHIPKSLRARAIHPPEPSGCKNGSAVCSPRADEAERNLPKSKTTKHTCQELRGEKKKDHEAILEVPVPPGPRLQIPGLFQLVSCRPSTKYAQAISPTAPSHNPPRTLEPWWNHGETLVEPYLRAAPDYPGAYLG